MLERDEIKDNIDGLLDLAEEGNWLQIDDQLGPGYGRINQALVNRFVVGALVQMRKRVEALEKQIKEAGIMK